MSQEQTNSSDGEIDNDHEAVLVDHKIDPDSVANVMPHALHMFDNNDPPREVFTFPSDGNVRLIPYLQHNQHCMLGSRVFPITRTPQFAGMSYEPKKRKRDASDDDDDSKSDTEERSSKRYFASFMFSDDPDTSVVEKFPIHKPVWIAGVLTATNKNAQKFFRKHNITVIGPDTGPDSVVRDEQGAIIGTKKLIMYFEP